ncbi:MAG: hypothetical protein K940chlam7_02061 [Chlamydiae bacterium]|nr:hypothetical protein [Chlamydiota bacterium]
MRLGLLLSIFVAFLPLVLFSCDDGSPTNDKFSIGHAILGNVNKTLSSRHNMNMGGFREATHRDDKKYKTMGLCFQIQRPVSKEEGRKLLIDCAEELLSQINTHPDFQQFMHEYPFTVKNIEIVMYVSTETGGTVYHPEIAIFSFSRGKVEYLTNSPENRYVFYSEEEETYEEALRIIEESK